MRSLLRNAALTGAALQLPGCVPIVCDPLPEPQTVDCAADDALVLYTTAYAYWQEVPDGLAVWLIADLSGTTNLAFTGQPTIAGGTVTGSTLLNQHLTLTLTPSEGAERITVTIPVICGESTKTVQAVLDVSETPAANIGVPITITEQ